MTSVLNKKKILMIIICAFLVISSLALPVLASPVVNYSFSLTKYEGNQYLYNLQKTDYGPADLHLNSLGDYRFIEGQDAFTFEFENTNYSEITECRTFTYSNPTGEYYRLQYFSGQAYPRTVQLDAWYDPAGAYNWGEADGWVNP